ncbi:MAG: recombinase family protein [Dehalococcoidales bacterium]|nr:recombinase family protein [Dehalococcoidales bacterium]
MNPTSSVAKRSPATLGEFPSEKIQAWHRDRMAVVYVRQSTPQQVLDHQESTRLQYGLRSRAEALGWSANRVLVIDDDLGKSGASAEGRVGFQRLVSEVSLDHVGIIIGIEMSRLARSNKDWHQLLELCSLFRTLIADVDGVYDPAQYNDRLLLGLKGTMSEAELHILKQRMYQGRLNKARRGELTFALPIGYVWQEPGKIGFDPDEQVQGVVRVVFRKFTELGTMGGLLRYLATHDIRVGVRVREGPGKGALAWRRPNRMTLQMMLKHPIYAGAYVFGRRQEDPRRQQPGRPRTGRVVTDPADWLALLPDHVPAYITWEQYEANLARLQANRARAETMGAVREGAALLAGLVACARCDCRMVVHYTGSSARHTYECTQLRNSYGGPMCQHIPGECLDRYVSQQVLAALEPAALELSLTATERLQQERDELTRLWRQRLERADYEAERAARQYHVVEPENRLVARTLERAWEEKLAERQQLEEEYHRFLRQQPRVLSAEERAAICRLAADIPALWTAPTTTAVDRKEIIRQVVERVVVDAEGATEQVRVSIHWLGGGRTDGTVIRPISRMADLSYYPQLCERVRALTSEGLSAMAIARRLNEAGYHSPREGLRFGEQGIKDTQRNLSIDKSHNRVLRREGLAPDEWIRSELAQILGLPQSSLYNWIQQGWVRAHREEQSPHRWVIWADDAEIQRLRMLHQRSLGDEARRRWTAASSEDKSAGNGHQTRCENRGRADRSEKCLTVAD